MDREKIIPKIQDKSQWDIIIIGGGATGLGTAVDAVSRGYDTLLLEQHDFAKGTSSRSTKLVHGGVRYLRQGDVKLVKEALRERGLMHQNAPHLVKNLSFIVPAYKWWEGPFYGFGLKIYDAMAGDLGLGPSKLLSKKETLKHLPTLETDGLDGGIIYHDAQFDDARMAIALMQTIRDQGGTAVNYMKVTDLLKSDSKITGVQAEDQETGDTYKLNAKCVINATGIFTDQIRQMDNPSALSIIQPSRGVHIVLDDSFQPGDSAMLVPHTDDGRVIFAIPWKERILIGTTDVPMEEPELEPHPTGKEIDYLLRYAQKYLKGDPTRADILSAYAGIRPLVSNSPDGDTADISRDHTLLTDPSGLITIAGGKWTTYRKMAEDTIDKAAEIGELESRKSTTEDLHLHGWTFNSDPTNSFHQYGSEASALKEIANNTDNGRELLHPNLPYTPAEVIWAARHEMARTVEDVLSRRTRSLLLDARASIAIAEPVADLLADELNKSQEWREKQVEIFTNLAEQYLVGS